MPKLPNKSHAQKQMDYNASQMNASDVSHQKTAKNREGQTDSNHK